MDQSRSWINQHQNENVAESLHIDLQGVIGIFVPQ